MAAARAGEAKNLADIDEEARITRGMFGLRNSTNPLTGMYDPEKEAQSLRNYDRVQGGGSLVAEEPPVAPPEGATIAGPGLFNPSGITSNVNPGVDTQAQFANSQATKGAREERDAWLRSTNQSDPFRQTSVYGTPKEKDNQLWEMYRDSLNGNKTISTGNSKSTASGTSYIVRGN